jgi:hypothetical protein
MGKQPTVKHTKPIPKLKERPVVENNKEETDFWDYLQEGLDRYSNSLKVYLRHSCPYL